LVEVLRPLKDFSKEELQFYNEDDKDIGNISIKNKEEFFLTKICFQKDYLSQRQTLFFL